MSGAGVRRTGGGRFDPTERNLYFLPAHPINLGLASPHHTHFLVALNAIADDEALAAVMAIAVERPLFLDSGVYELAMSHARAHGMTMDQALALAPDEVDGWEALKAKYVRVVRQYGDRLWGYTELDQGGRANKVKTRAWLESIGLKPMPIYHPINDGWDYFDELASTYDRIAVGNLVRAAPSVRKRLLATIAHRRRVYPHLWIHLLGTQPTPNHAAFAAAPRTSTDASSWLQMLRWPQIKHRCALANFSPFDRSWFYRVGDHAQYEKATRHGAVIAHFQQRDWQMLGAGYEPGDAP